jgi:hypothetical protein
MMMKILKYGAIGIVLLLVIGRLGLPYRRWTFRESVL